MSAARVVYHLARADFLERVRRYSFLILLGLVVFLGYQVAIGNVNVRLGNYRGEFNSAWVGSMMAIIASVFLRMYLFVQKVVPLDFVGLTPESTWYVYPSLAILLLALALLARQRQLTTKNASR